MNIIDDRSYFEKDSKLWLDAGLAKETAYMLHFSYCPTDEDRRREELACIGRTSEERSQFQKEIARKQSEAMKALMDDIAARFVVYQYADADPMPYNSAFWELSCSCYRQDEPPYERDYSQFTLAFNNRQPPEWRTLICKHLLNYLREHYQNQTNLQVVVHYSVWYDRDRIKAEAQKAMEVMKDRRCRFNEKNGQLVLSGDRLWFKPRNAKRLTYVDDSDLLLLLWAMEPSEKEQRRHA